MIVYIATFPNGKVYVGATTIGLTTRKAAHLRAARIGVKNKFYNAVRKYGSESIVWSVHSEHSNTEDMFATEQYLIETLRSQSEGYNTTIGGEGNPGRIRSDEERSIISAAQRKRFECKIQRGISRDQMVKWVANNPEKSKSYAEKRAEAVRSDAVRAKISQSLRQRIVDHPEERVRLSNQAKRVYESRPEVRSSISRSLGGSPVSVWKNGILVAVYSTLSECSREVGASVGNIGMVINGKRNHAKGFTFTREAA